MNRQLDHMVRLIDDLLDVSRLSRGLLSLKREDLDLGALVQSTVESIRPWFERRSQILSTTVEEGISAHADPTRVAQIVTNLLHNATKFTPEGGSIKVELSKEADMALIRVVDSGMGIRQDQLERVFDMFAHIDRKGAAPQPGLGIGLALARRLAEMHGGSLTLVSEGEGRGAAFTLSIPALTRATEPTRRTRGEDSPGNGSRPLGIVIVEDNDDVADVLSSWLEELGHRVTVARTGERGLGAIREARPDLVICDLGLPELSGLDVCRRVRAEGGECQPTMVALTGWGRQEDLRASKEAGFDLHLVKPVASEALHAVLRSALDERADPHARSP
jgi:CheY-like chemotaxis protein/two-component sensor histidine kinase